MLLAVLLMLVGSMVNSPAEKFKNLMVLACKSLPSQTGAESACSSKTLQITIPPDDELIQGFRLALIEPDGFLLLSFELPTERYGSSVIYGCKKFDLAAVSTVRLYYRERNLIYTFKTSQLRRGPCITLKTEQGQPTLKRGDEILQPEESPAPATEKELLDQLTAH